MSKNIANCEKCEFNIGDTYFPICDYEEKDQKNNYRGLTSKELDTMYTENCVRFNRKMK